MVSNARDGRAGITSELVQRLIRSQLPQWSDLAVSPVATDGWDNRTYRLGSNMSVRLPTAAGYVPAVAKEAKWLPFLSPQLPVPIPTVLAVGMPGDGYPFPWSVRGWLTGETAQHGRIADLPTFAESVAEFLRALGRCDASGGPAAGAHSWFRGASLAHYDTETRRCLSRVDAVIDAARAAEVWDDALASQWAGKPVWFHGDVAAGNLLVEDGQLAAVLDFGTSGVGDPACDLVIAWTLFDGPSRGAFRAAVGHESATWARARGWALWKALLGLADAVDTDPARVESERRLIEKVLSDDFSAS